jgi:hypothetical protein
METKRDTPPRPVRRGTSVALWVWPASADLFRRVCEAEPPPRRSLSAEFDMLIRARAAALGILGDPIGHVIGTGPGYVDIVGPGPVPP